MKTPKGKIWSWILFILTMVAFFGALLFLQKQISKPTVTPSGQQAETADTGSKSFAQPTIPDEEKDSLDLEAFNKAIVSGGDCENIQFNDILKKQCQDTRAYQLGIEQNNETECAKISDQDLKQDCFDQVYFSLASQNSNSTFCQKIINTELKQNCLDRSYLTQLETIQKPEDCEAIANVLLKQECLDQYYLTKSINKLNSADCEKIQNQDNVKKCQQNIVQTSKIIELATQKTSTPPSASVSTASSASDCTDSTCMDQKNYQLAFEKKDLSFCNEIKDSQKKQNCLSVQSVSINQSYLRQALSTKDVSLCNKIIDPSLQSLCLTQIQDL